MPDRSYVGIDRNENNEWVVALWIGDKVFLSRPFKNTPGQLADLVRFISEHCVRPKICLNPTSPAALKLIKFVGGIPDAEVLMMSAAGLRMHRSWLPKQANIPAPEDGTGHAFILARYAERIM